MNRKRPRNIVADENTHIEYRREYLSILKLLKY